MFEMKEFRVVAVMMGKTEEVQRIFASSAVSAIKGTMIDIPILYDGASITGWVVELKDGQEEQGSEVTFSAIAHRIGVKFKWFVSVTVREVVEPNTAGLSNTRSKPLVQRQAMHLVSRGIKK